tara:strand:+ start:324 stop:602 length:279 start_codon:yes stop_codon:yes gene_type:complete
MAVIRQPMPLLVACPGNIAILVIKLGIAGGHIPSDCAVIVSDGEIVSYSIGFVAVLGSFEYNGTVGTGSSTNGPRGPVTHWGVATNVTGIKL